MAMDMLLLIGSLVGVVVVGFVSGMDMGMGVDMLVGMGMDQLAMAVDMGVGMGMFVGMLQPDGVLDHQNRGSDHDDQPHIKLDTGLLVQQEHTERHTQKWCDGIIGAGFGSTKILLGLDVEIDAKAISHEAQQQAAPSTSREPTLNRKLPSPSKLRAMLAKVTRMIAKVNRRDKASRNTKKAIIEVATISKLFSRDALAALVRFRPIIRKIGAAISNRIIASV